MKKYKNTSILILLLILVIMTIFIKKNFSISSNLSYKGAINKKNKNIKDFFNLNKKEDKLLILTQGNYRNYNNVEILSYEYHATNNGILISRWHSQTKNGRISIYINNKLVFDLTGKTEIIFNDIEIKKGDIVKCFFYYGYIDYYLSILY